MSAKRFTTKITIKVVLFAIISFIVLIVLGNPIITNEIALGQMSNSNEWYILMELYNNVRFYTQIAYSFITVLFVGTTIYDIFKFTR
jgi:hypothetical protein